MSDTWWAAVRYSDGEAENVSVQKIKNFQPTHITDYEQGYKYTVKTSAWNNKGKEEKYKAYIVRLAETLPALEKSLHRKRAHCPPLELRDSDGPITTTQDEVEVLDPTEVQRNKEKRKCHQKKKASDNMMIDIIDQAQRNKAYMSSSEPALAAPKDDAQPSTSHSDWENQDKDAVIQQLKEKVRMLEKALENKTEDPVMAKLREMEDKFKDVGHLNEKMVKIEKYLSEYEPHFKYEYVAQWVQSQGDVSDSTNFEN